MQSFPIYLFIFIVFLNRYVFGWYLTILKGKRLDPKITGYEPTITIVVPLFNEGRSIYDTIKSLVELEYPSDKLEVTVVDDCSTDDSCEWACKAAAQLSNVRVLRNDVNMGKRKGINAAVRASRAEVIVSVDSDVIVYPTALRELVARFTRTGDRGGRRPDPRLEPEPELAHPAPDDQVLLRPRAPEEPRARARSGDVPVGLPHRVSPLAC